MPCGTCGLVTGIDGPGWGVSSTVSGKERVVVVDEAKVGIVEDFGGDDPRVIGADNKCWFVDAEEESGEGFGISKFLP